MTEHAGRVAGLLAPTRDAGATDAELLGRFVTDRDGSAFAALVHRHGAMVFAVCRRVVRDWHVAEDAFQATFLVLALRAASVWPPEAVAGWLHGVALRVAKNARRTHLRQTAREHPTAEFCAPAASTDPDPDLADVLDDELRKLPGKYRELLVACDLQGRCRAPVAASLGIPEGTLSSRLTTARKMLAQRLAKRGVTPAVAAGVALNGPTLVACEVPRMVLASAARLGCGPADTVSAGVASLASGVIRAMTYRAWVLFGVLVLAVGTALGLACTAWAATDNPLPERPVAHPPAIVLAPRAAEPVPPKAAPKPPKGPNKLLFYRAGHLVTTDPDGTNEKQLIDAQKTQFHPTGVSFSPDGTRVCLAHTGGSPAGPKSTILVVCLDGKDTGTDHATDVPVLWACWSPDGTRLLVTEAAGAESAQKFEVTHHVIEVTTGKRTRLELPSDQLIFDWGRDGCFLGMQALLDKETKEPDFRLWVVAPDGKPKVEIPSTDPAFHPMGGRFSPDGRRVLFGLERKADKTRWAHQLAVYDLVSKKTTPVADVPLNAEIQSACWSPDGKQIAWSWHLAYDRTQPKAEEQEIEWHVTVCDPDGKNPKTIASEKGKAREFKIGRVEWR